MTRRSASECASHSRSIRLAAHCQGRVTALPSPDRLGEGLSAFERDTLRTRDAQNRPTPELVSRSNDVVC